MTRESREAGPMNRILEAFKVLTKKKDKAAGEKTKPPATDASPPTPKYFEQGLPLLEKSGLRSIEKDDIITAAVAYVGVYNPRTGTQGGKTLTLSRHFQTRVPVARKHGPQPDRIG